MLEDVGEFEEEKRRGTSRTNISGAVVRSGEVVEGGKDATASVQATCHHNLGIRTSSRF